MKYNVLAIVLLFTVQLKCSTNEPIYKITPAITHSLFLLKRNSIPFKTASSPYIKEGKIILYKSEDFSGACKEPCHDKKGNMNDTKPTQMRYTVEHHRRMRDSCSGE